MSTEIQRLVAEETAALETNPDAPVSTASRVSQPNRARFTVSSIRLNPDEMAEVQALAEVAGLPASTLVRSWIIERIRAEHGEVSDAESELRSAQSAPFTVSWAPSPQWTWTTWAWC